MTITSKISIEDFGLISFFSKNDVNELKSKLYRRKYKKGQTIFMEGDDRERLYFLIDGYVKMETYDQEGLLSYHDYIKPGLMFPISGLYCEQDYKYSAEAITDVDVYYIPTQLVESLMVKNSRALIYIIRKFTNMMRVQESRVKQSTIQNATDRVIQTVSYLMNILGEEKGNEIIIHCPFTTTDLAKISGTSRETVSGVLKQLRESEILSVVSKKIHIHKPDYFGKL